MAISMTFNQTNNQYSKKERENHEKMVNRKFWHKREPSQRYNSK